MVKECRNLPSQEEIEKRTTKMLELFNAIVGQPLNKFPVPPFTKWINGSIVEAERGHITLKVLVRPEMANPTQILHGGMQSAILDDTIGITCSTLGQEGFHLSIDMNVDYLGKVKVGEELLSEARIIREGKKIVNAYAELRTLEGKKIAQCTSNLLVTQHKPEYHDLKI